jgi:hypothetical protein
MKERHDIRWHEPHSGPSGPRIVRTRASESRIPMRNIVLILVGVIAGLLAPVIASGRPRARDR